MEHGGKVVQFVEVTADDVVLANRLAHQVLGSSLDELPPQTRLLLLALDRMVAEDSETMAIKRADYRFTRRAARGRVGMGNSQLKVHLGRLVELELVLAHRAGPGRVTYELVYDGGGGLSVEEAPALENARSGDVSESRS